MADFSRPELAISSPSGKKRRVLGEIQNTDHSFVKPMMINHGKKSLGVDHPRMDTISPKRKQSRPTGIPEPSSSSSSELVKVVSESNRRASQIPAPQVHTRKSDIHSKLASFKHRLDQGSKIIPDGKQEEGWNANESNQQNEDLSTRISLNQNLDNQAKDLQNRLYDLEQDNDDLRRLYKKLKHKILDIGAEIDILERKLRFKTDSTEKNLSNKRTLFEIDLQALKQKYDDEFNETKFQLEEEVKLSVEYKDELLSNEIESLKIEKERLQTALSDVKSEKQKRIKQENEALLKEVDDYLEVKTTQVENVASVYESRNNELETILDEVNAIQNKVKSKNQENDHLQKKIDEIEYNYNNFDDLKSQLLLNLKALETDLDEIRKENDQWELKYDDLKKIHNHSVEKIQNYNNHRRILENSIMDHEGKLRVYIKIPTSIAVSNDCEFSLNDRLFHFNKVFPNDISDHELIKEYTCLIKNTISNTNVSLILLGEQDSKSIITKTLLSSFDTFTERISSFKDKSWSFRFYLQSVRIDDNNCSDLLNSEKIISHSKFAVSLSELNSTKIEITNSIQLTQTLNNIYNSEYPIAYWINIDAQNNSKLKSFENDLIIIDLTGQTLKNQLRILSEDHIIDGPISKFVNYAYCHSKCLHISHLQSIDSDTEGLLRVFEIINATDTPYKRK
ncbi:hypothetical protein HYPBUDRAFT_109216 [Hyphopichia burtonii NRRL Y-1933]|uniref:Spindle pole body-associated protein Vik1/Cik1 microtubule binding domain-containing protein n=1 Tax=Hyphopichia burtonii NRRL Y-1933 TaxID=984485 RepID=A0A1E4RJ59_9ASCO|nr:hypothetical protein HYPBUDRAFT_109216 [Hyphopichia burtonii NRRL Y-1933]ODV67283.1 hypothetical protein HYPBUDRAFT_109216 [Hyphopichia burtonii NRRL Y-1933]